MLAPHRFAVASMKILYVILMISVIAAGKPLLQGHEDPEESIPYNAWPIARSRFHQPPEDVLNISKLRQLDTQTTNSPFFTNEKLRSIGRTLFVLFGIPFIIVGVIVVILHLHKICTQGSIRKRAHQILHWNSSDPGGPKLRYVKNGATNHDRMDSQEDLMLLEEL